MINRKRNGRSELTSVTLQKRQRKRWKVLVRIYLAIAMILWFYWRKITNEEEEEEEEKQHNFPTPSPPPCFWSLAGFFFLSFFLSLSLSPWIYSLSLSTLHSFPSSISDLSVAYLSGIFTRSLLGVFCWDHRVCLQCNFSLFLPSFFLSFFLSCFPLLLLLLLLLLLASAPLLSFLFQVKLLNKKKKRKIAKKMFISFNFCPPSPPPSPPPSLLIISLRVWTKNMSCYYKFFFPLFLWNMKQILFVFFFFLIFCLFFSVCLLVFFFFCLTLNNNYYYFDISLFLSFSPVPLPWCGFQCVLS